MNNTHYYGDNEAADDSDDDAGRYEIHSDYPELDAMSNRERQRFFSIVDPRILNLPPQLLTMGYLIQRRRLERRRLASPRRVRRLILRLCQEDYHSPRLLGTALNRSEKVLIRHYLRPMVYEGLLKDCFPKHASVWIQAYKVKAEKEKTPEGPPLRVVLYARSPAHYIHYPEGQFIGCRTKVEPLGGIVVATFDEVCSVYTDLHDRPALSAALEMVASGQADALVCLHPTRLTKDSELLRVIEERVKPGQIIYVESDH